MGKRTKYSHVRRIKNLQNVMHKVVLPGTIVRFGYNTPNSFDKVPLVLVIYNDLAERKFHGLNLNYLQESKIKLIFKRMIQGAGGARKTQDENIIVEEDPKNPHKEKLNKPEQRVIREAYTRLRLPTFRDVDGGGNPISLAEAKIQMKRLYEKILKLYIKEQDMYRTYHHNNIKQLKLVTYDLEGLIQS